MWYWSAASKIGACAILATGCGLYLVFPGGGGEMLLSEIRARPELEAVPLLAVTAAAMQGDRERLLAHGFDGYISKPIDLAKFGNEIESWLRRGRAGVLPEN